MLVIISAVDEDPKSEFEAMKEHWHNSVFHQNQNLTEAFVDRIFKTPGDNSSGKLHVFVKGTNFQLKVWEALLRIPIGEVTTYKGIAETIKHPKAMQAVWICCGC
jgi:AraC family transcriptional regulator of adaptative response/methylated-DNA-[protein]-cysteine methyltransferase